MVPQFSGIYGIVHDIGRRSKFLVSSHGSCSSHFLWPLVEVVQFVFTESPNFCNGLWFLLFLMTEQLAVREYGFWWVVVSCNQDVFWEHYKHI